MRLGAWETGLSPQACWLAGREGVGVGPGAEGCGELGEAPKLFELALFSSSLL